MNQALIFQPILVLVLLTYVMYCRMVMARFAAVKNKQVSPRFFEVHQGEGPPASVAALGRNVINLFELPVLFYLACVVGYITLSVDVWFLGLAWLFVLARVAHSLIHTGGNPVLLRMRVFAIGYVILGIMWVILAWRVLTL